MAALCLPWVPTWPEVAMAVVPGHGVHGEEPGVGCLSVVGLKTETHGNQSALSAP